MPWRWRNKPKSEVHVPERANGALRPEADSRFRVVAPYKQMRSDIDTYSMIGCKRRRLNQITGGDRLLR